MSRIKRKFKSFQREEKPETYSSTYKSDSNYVDDFLHRNRRDWSSEKKTDTAIDDHRESLLKIFPNLDFNKLKLFAISRIQGYGVTQDKEYVVIRRDNDGGYLYIINDNNQEEAYPDHWFKPPYKKYDFDVYARANIHNVGLTRDRLYKIIGETDKGYEIIDDRKLRSSYYKNNFSTPEKKEESSSDTKEKKPFQNDQTELSKLFPKFDFSKLQTYAVCNYSLGGLLTKNEDYRVIKRERGQINVINNKGLVGNYPSHWFGTEYKKYNIDVYARARAYLSGLTRDKSYRLIGETAHGYEIINDRGLRQNYNKANFGFPEK